MGGVELCISEAASRARPRASRGLALVVEQLNPPPAYGRWLLVFFVANQHGLGARQGGGAILVGIWAPRPARGWAVLSGAAGVFSSAILVWGPVPFCPPAGVSGTNHARFLPRPYVRETALAYIHICQLFMYVLGAAMQLRELPT